MGRARGQLPLDFTDSVSQRHRKAVQRALEQPELFAVPNIDLDVHLHSPKEAIAELGGDVDRSRAWLERVVGPTQHIRGRKVTFPAAYLDRLLSVRPPAKATLDAACLAVARARWAHALGLRPLVVRRDRQRLLASSVRWPSALAVTDAPWPAIAVLDDLGVPLEVTDTAKALMTNKLVASGSQIATAGLSGSAIVLDARRPELLEELGLPGLGYLGGPGTGRYRMPLLLADCLLTQPGIELSETARRRIVEVSRRPRGFTTRDGFPWTLYPFQTRDAARAARILETTGGVLLAGEMGTGKAVAASTPVMTPGGPVPIGELRVGDQVLGTDGRPHAVTGVFPQGVRPLFRVTFSDGATVDCDDEHLWAVNTALQNRRGNPHQVLRLAEIRTKLRDGAGNRHFIPVPAPLELDGCGDLPLDPYLVGALIGDGCLPARGSVSFATADEFCIQEVERLLPEGTRASPTGTRGQSWNLVGSSGPNSLKASLRDLGLLGKRAWEKHIPAAYLYAPLPARISLLQGLMDTGGDIKDPKQLSSVEYTTTSVQLARDVQTLVASLGGTARITGPFNKPYTHNSEKRRGRDAWRVCLALPETINPFRLPRKAQRYQPRGKYPPARAITSVEPIGPGEAVCISVDAPDQLFVLANGVTTHNTTVALALTHELDIWPLLVIAPLSAFSTWERQLDELGKRSYLATEAPKKSWAAIESRAYEAVVISYDRLPAFIELIEHYGFKGIVADEVQRIRTPGSRRSRAVRALASATPYRIGLSGTPLTNKVDDLLPVGAFLVPGEWKPRATAKDLADLYPGDAVEAVAEHLGTMMVRRRMSEVGAKLPKRRDHRVYVPLTPEQRRALADLEAEAEAAKEAGEFDQPRSKLHAFVRLQRMRQIIADPAGAGVGGPNPKVAAAIDLAEDFLAQGRKGVIFCADRNVFRELGVALDRAGIGWVGIWGSTPIHERIANEKRFHNDPDTKVVLCTIQAGSESWSASPTGTWLISCSYVYAPSTLSQMEARVYRMSSNPDGPDIEILYLHAKAPGGTLDDRFVEILEVKKQLFAQVVDRTQHKDETQVHLSLGDLTYMLTGKRDEALDAREADNEAALAREQARKDHARRTAHGHKARNRLAADGFHDDGSMAQTLEELLDAEDALAATAALAGEALDEASEDGDLFDEGDSEPDDEVGD